MQPSRISPKLFIALICGVFVGCNVETSDSRSKKSSSKGLKLNESDYLDDTETVDEVLDNTEQLADSYASVSEPDGYVDGDADGSGYFPGEDGDVGLDGEEISDVFADATLSLSGTSDSDALIAHLKSVCLKNPGSTDASLPSLQKLTLSVNVQGTETKTFTLKFRCFYTVGSGSDHFAAETAREPEDRKLKDAQYNLVYYNRFKNLCGDSSKNEGDALSVSGSRQKSGGKILVFSDHPKNGANETLMLHDFFSPFYYGYGHEFYYRDRDSGTTYAYDFRICVKSTESGV